MTQEEAKTSGGEAPRGLVNMPINVPMLYANGVMVTLTLTDISLTIAVNGQPTHLLNMSLTTAKTLSANLSKAISDFESKTGTKVLEIKEVSEFMKAKKV